MIMEEDQNCILEELDKVFRGIPLELPYLKSYRWERGALIYVCANKQSGQWLIKATDNQRMVSGVKLRATNAKNFSQTHQDSSQDKGNGCSKQEELLKLIKHLNRGLHIEH
jgi:hypothetical protein